MSKPMFQQRHYTRVANTLARVRLEMMVTVTPDVMHVWEQTIESFVRTFGADNPRFKSMKFRNVCHGSTVS